ncbi:hypothetical protein [Pseudalkalibacillus salsuginis]|uniref:hypothetical protein n=1 Tax=Pseudalkalibacillus salsuginis TaxID=2910972 RepID=UPI001F312EA9|nr:hypothetical protein [Pseudalkalibacillus salsuginis]MCF6410363.1 hypothetical protein [Pseudalkalibacillus salsuginis]
MIRTFVMLVVVFCGLLTNLLTIGDALAKNIKVEYLPSIFDDGTRIPQRIRWRTWEETDEIFPRKSTFEVVDIETGLSFTVQRRAGERHADVQPLTKTDTEIMKAIYGGNWSWKRRAIFIRNGSEMIPASMHGMPHGAGTLANNFPGHFCIHLPNSTTHRTNREDPSHQLMILKASGRLDEFIENAASDELASIFIHAVNQEDFTIINKLVSHPIKKRILKKLFFVHPNKPLSDKEPSTLLVTEYSVEVITNNRKGLDKHDAIMRLERDSLTSRWTVDFETLLEADD